MRWRGDFANLSKVIARAHNPQYSRDVPPPNWCEWGAFYSVDTQCLQCDVLRVQVLVRAIVEEGRKERRCNGRCPTGSLRDEPPTPEAPRSEISEEFSSF